MFIEVKNISKKYEQADGQVAALQPISFDIEKNTTTAIIGPSGSGKTTLLSMIAGLDSPTSGSISIDENRISQLSESDLGIFRSQNVGIIFQQFHLMPHLTAYENVCLPLEILGVDKIDQKVSEVLELVGLSHRKHHLPSQLSGGEQQRVAIARAIVHNPKLLLADEPSGNLDTVTGNKVMDLIFSLVEKKNLTLILVTHDNLLAQRCQKTIYLKSENS